MSMQTTPHPKHTGHDGKKQRMAAVRRHDIFNLFALGALNTLNFLYLFYGTGFQYFWWASITYFVLDFVWLIADPQCVKSPTVIAAHHVVAAVYTLVPMFYPNQALSMSYVMTVECSGAELYHANAGVRCHSIQVNTWLLVAKRVMPSALLTWLFYFTWIVIRNLLFPYLIYVFYQEYLKASAASNSAWHPMIVAPVFQFGLCVLNFQWTWELFNSIRYKSIKHNKGQHQL